MALWWFHIGASVGKTCALPLIKAQRITVYGMLSHQWGFYITPLL